MRISIQYRLLACLVLLSANFLLGQTTETRTTFTVKYVTPAFVYLDGGRSAGLREGMELTVKRLAPGQPLMAAEEVGVLVVTSVASNSALGEIKTGEKVLQKGDLAFLSPKDLETAQPANSQSGARKYAQVVSFSQGDPLEEELRASVQKPPLPEVNRVRGRIAFEHNTIRERGSTGSNSSQEGVVLRADMTRIGGTYWNFTGYWRGRINSLSTGTQQQTLTELLNRTYHIGLFYNNPQSHYVAGFGRLLLPWATSLNTLDGGYFGRRLGKTVTLGVFGGSTPDPTAWNYRRDRQMGGIFTNVEGGDFEHVRYTTTVGVALTRRRWLAERQFLFLENGLFLRNYFSIFYNLEADNLVKGRLGAISSGPVVSRSFLTLRLQPRHFISFDLSHNYFRDIPTFDTQLISTGLLDRLLFQGLSGGVRVELPLRISLYTNVGRNKRENETKPAWNGMAGIALNRVWKTGVRADFRFSQFDSSFGKGSYKALSFSRNIGDQFHFELQGGQQNLRSLLTRQQNVQWISTSADWFFTTHFLLGSGVMFYRGGTMDYDQYFVNLGYRF